jgi:hypothetical protein
VNNTNQSSFSKEIITISAVTGASEIGFCRSGGDTLWTATIELVAWCDLKQNGSIKREKVRLEWMVSDENMELKSELLDKNQIVKLQVRVSEGSKKRCY